MRRLKIIIVSHSEIMAHGISTMLSSSPSRRFEITVISPKSFSEFRPTLSGSDIIIADTLSFSADQITQLKNSTLSSPTIIGLYSSALPVSVTRIYDHLLSVYADRNQILQTIEKASESLNRTDTVNTDELTPREKEIVVRVVKGKSNKEIANELNVSIHTVTTHRRNIASKLQIHSPSALTIYAIVSKLVAIDEIKSELL